MKDPLRGLSVLFLGSAFLRGSALVRRKSLNPSIVGRERTQMALRLSYHFHYSQQPAASMDCIWYYVVTYEYNHVQYSSKGSESLERHVCYFSLSVFP